ncbi:MAG: hypothetical protein EA405_04035 [Rhodospirillales bacterium]|nr:MAG: hypothetical protein EA405_04035 [Rhodospirillales bacterium]
MVRASPVVVAASAAVILAGCTQAVRMHSATDSTYDTGIRSTFAYAAGVGEMNTVIVGNPFDLPRDAFERFMTATMRGNHFGPPTTFTTTPSDDARSDYRIVVTFDTPVGMPKSRLCGPVEDMPRMASSERLGMTTAFCWRDRIISWVDAEIARPAGPDEGAFRNMVATSMWNLLPTQDHMSSRDDSWL